MRADRVGRHRSLVQAEKDIGYKASFLTLPVLVSFVFLSYFSLCSLDVAYPLFHSSLLSRSHGPFLHSILSSPLFFFYISSFFFTLRPYFIIRPHFLSLHRLTTLNTLSVHLTFSAFPFHSPFLISPTSVSLLPPLASSNPLPPHNTHTHTLSHTSAPSIIPTVYLNQHSPSHHHVAPLTRTVNFFTVLRFLSVVWAGFEDPYTIILSALHADNNQSTFY